MSYTRDTSEDLVWNSSTNSYEPASTPATSGYLTDGNGNLLMLNGEAVYISDNPAPAPQEPSYGNYYIMEDDSIMPVYLDVFDMNGVRYGTCIISDGVTDMEYTGLCGYRLLSATNYIIHSSAMSFGSITDVNLSSSDGLSSLGIKKIVYKSVTGKFDARYTGILNVVGTSASTLTTIDISNATSIYLRGACIGLTALQEVKMDKAENVTITRNGASIGGTFKNTSVTELRFPALKTASEIEIQYMLSDVDGCTVHFPSNLESTIQGLAGYPNFGGTNTTLLFDLPATS